MYHAHLWQAGQDAADLLQNSLLLSSGGIGLAAANTNRDADVAAAGVNDGGLSGESGAATLLNISSGAGGGGVDAGENEFELRSAGAAGSTDGWEVDIQEDAGREVWSAGSNEGVGDVGCKGGIDGGVRWNWGGSPGDLRARGARESNGRVTLGGSIAGSTDSAGNLDGRTKVGTDIGTSYNNIRLAEVWCDDVLKTILNRGNWVGVDVVEAGVGGVATIGSAASCTAVEFTCRSGLLGSCVVRALGSGNHRQHRDEFQMSEVEKWIFLFTCSALVLGRSRDNNVISSRGQGIVEGSDVKLGPSIIIGEEDVDGLGGEGQESESQRVTHGE